MTVFKKKRKSQVEEPIKSIRLDYLSGHPEFQQESKAFVGRGPESMTISMNGRVLHIKKVEWKEKRKRSIKRMATGGIIGGVTGSIGGLILGTALGSKKKDESIALVSYKEEHHEGILCFRCDQVQYRGLISLLW